MEGEHNRSGGTGLSALGQGILGDVERLLTQHLELLRADMKRELAQAGRAGAPLLAGGGAAAAGSMLGLVGLVHLLHETTRIPLSGCYLLVGGGLGLLGAGLITAGVQEAAKIDLMPHQTLKALQEELTTARGELAPAPSAPAGTRT